MWIDLAERTTAQQRVIDLCEVLRQTELADGALRKSNLMWGSKPFLLDYGQTAPYSRQCGLLQPCSRLS